MGIGEALCTALDRKGRPTPLAHTLLRAPISRMDILNKKEIKDLVNSSDLVDKYSEEIDRKSAYEILDKKIKEAQSEENQEKLNKDEGSTRRVSKSKKESGFFESISKNTMMRQLGRTILREVTRGILGSLGVKK